MTTAARTKLKRSSKHYTYIFDYAFLIPNKNSIKSMFVSDFVSVTFVVFLLLFNRHEKKHNVFRMVFRQFAAQCVCFVCQGKRNTLPALGAFACTVCTNRNKQRTEKTTAKHDNNSTGNRKNAENQSSHCFFCAHTKRAANRNRLEMMMILNEMGSSCWLF